jgi:predicted RND superfamily exporter protein
MASPARPATPAALARSRTFVRFTLRHGRWLWVLALLAALPAARGTFGLYARLSSDVEQLLPREAPSVVAIDELRARVPGLQYLGVVVDAGEAQRLPAAERFLEDLAARVRQYPPALVRAVKVGAEEERRFLEKNGALYADLEDLQAVRARIAERKRWEMSKTMGILLDDAPAPALDFSDIDHKYRDKAQGVSRLARGRFSSSDGKTSLLLIEVGGFSTGASTARALLGRVRADIAALGGPGRYASGMRLGFTADVAVSVEEISALEADLTIASLLVVGAVVLVILLYFRWWRSVPALFAPLLLAVVYAFGLSTLPPWNVDRLNSNTAFLGSIIVGNGINFAILFLARYVEARRRGTGVEDSLTEAVWGARLGTLVAALAAGVAYGSLLGTQFRGFRQFGAIGGIGMVLCWAVTFVLMPPLVAWLDRGPGTGTGPRPVAEKDSLMRPVARWVAAHPSGVTLAGVVLTLVAATVLPRLDSSMLESDFAHLRRRDTWTTGEGFWGRKMDALLGRYLSPTVMLADSPEQATALAERVRAAAARPPLANLVSEVRGPDNVVPSDQPAKIAAVEAIRRLLTPATRAAVQPEQLRRLDQLLGDKPLTPITAQDLPPSLATGFRERDGTFGRAVLVFPSLSKANWKNDNLAAYTAELRRLAVDPGGGPAARVAGALPLSADIVSSIGRDGPLASGAAFAGVLVLVLLMFRLSRHAVFVVGSLLVGVLWMTAATFFLGVKINFVNFIAFPITFGIGVDYAVNVMARYVQDGEREIEGPIRSTGAAVALCSLTTIIGYSSLLLAKNQGLFHFGLVAVVGEIACLVTALALLPATLALLGRSTPSARRSRPHGGNGVTDAHPASARGPAVGLEQAVAAGGEQEGRSP